MMFRLPRRLVLLCVLMWAVLAVAIGAVALAASGDKMIAPANYTYRYPANTIKPACTAGSHFYSGWEYWRAPAGTSTVSATLVCNSSQSATNAGWGWRAMTVGTAIVP